MRMYNPDGKRVYCEKDQMEILKEAGYTREAPPVDEPPESEATQEEDEKPAKTGDKEKDKKPVLPRIGRPGKSAK